MGIGGGFGNTAELHVKNYREAMAADDKEKWKEAIHEEYERMQQHGVFEPVLISTLPPNFHRIDSTWAMKHKASGKYRARLAARGFKQVQGAHYDPDTKSSPVACDATIRTVLTLGTMAGWEFHVVDVQGAFLNGEFEDGEQIYMTVPDGFKRYYDPKKYVLLLRRTLYGLIQAALAFWRKLVLAFLQMQFKRSKADPCLFYKRTDA
jgi:hypothetical protein